MATDRGGEENLDEQIKEKASKESSQGPNDGGPAQEAREEKAEHEDEDDDDDDETCGFCRFMRAGGCKKEFNAWSACVDANRGEGHNFTEECRDETVALQCCMEQHQDYYKDFMLDPDAEGSGEGAQGKPEGSQEAGLDDQKPQASAVDGKDGTDPAGEKEGAAGGPKADEEESDADVQPTGMVMAASADVGVEEPLPPTDTLLSGLEGQFQPSSESESQEGGDSQGGADGEEGQPEEGQEEGGDDEHEEEEEEKPVIEVKTAAHDPRFPSTNQARHCYTRYNEYHRCVAQKGEDAPDCSIFQRAYRSLCPSEWLERWNEQREEGTWPGRY